MNDGGDFCGVKWISNPADGFLCLVSTRRTLDVNGHCCDYERCAVTIDSPVSSTQSVIDRCLLAPHGDEKLHHGRRCRRWSSRATVKV